MTYKRKLPWSLLAHVQKCYSEKYLELRIKNMRYHYEVNKELCGFTLGTTDEKFKEPL